MYNKKPIRIADVIYVTQNGKEILQKELSPELYQTFCDTLEESRLKNNILWPELDQRYKRDKG